MDNVLERRAEKRDRNPPPFLFYFVTIEILSFSLPHPIPHTLSLFPPSLALSFCRSALFLSLSLFRLPLLGLNGLEACRKMAGLLPFPTGASQGSQGCGGVRYAPRYSRHFRKVTPLWL